MEKQNTVTVEIRRTSNDNIVDRFEHDGSMNVFTAGYNKICEMFGMNRVQAETVYYVTEA